MPHPLPAPDSPPPLRLPDAPLPPYRYVPGVHPHPFRHRDGHLYTDGRPPPEPAWTPVPWEDDRAWLRGMDLFDHRYYWEAHEVWEAIWHCVPRGDPFHGLLQGLIQAAAFALKRHMGHEEAAARLLSRAERRLREAAAPGAVQRGVDLPATIAALRAFSAGGPWPVLSGPAPRRPGPPTG